MHERFEIPRTELLRARSVLNAIGVADANRARLIFRDGLFTAATGDGPRVTWASDGAAKCDRPNTQLQLTLMHIRKVLEAPTQKTIIFEREEFTIRVDTLSGSLVRSLDVDADVKAFATVQKPGGRPTWIIAAEECAAIAKHLAPVAETNTAEKHAGVRIENGVAMATDRSNIMTLRGEGICAHDATVIASWAFAVGKTIGGDGWRLAGDDAESVVLAEQGPLFLAWGIVGPADRWPDVSAYTAVEAPVVMRVRASDLLDALVRTRYAGSSRALRHRAWLRVVQAEKVIVTTEWQEPVGRIGPRFEDGAFGTGEFEPRHDVEFEEWCPGNTSVDPDVQEVMWPFVPSVLAAAVKAACGENDSVEIRGGVDGVWEIRGTSGLGTVMKQATWPPGRLNRR